MYSGGTILHLLRRLVRNIGSYYYYDERMDVTRVYSNVHVFLHVYIVHTQSPFHSHWNTRDQTSQKGSI